MIKSDCEPLWRLQQERASFWPLMEFPCQPLEVCRQRSRNLRMSTAFLKGPQGSSPAEIPTLQTFVLWVQVYQSLLPCLYQAPKDRSLPLAYIRLPPFSPVLLWSAHGSYKPRSRWDCFQFPLLARNLLWRLQTYSEEASPNVSLLGVWIYI